MEEPLQVRADVVIPGAELWFTASRSGGPGGQHVNKTNSRVTLHWDLSRTTALTDPQRARVLARLAPRLNQDQVLCIDVDTERSQFRNRELARERLAAIVRAALHEPRRRVPTKATPGARRRRLKAKAERSAVKRARQRPDPAD